MASGHLGSDCLVPKISTCSCLVFTFPFWPALYYFASSPFSCWQRRKQLQGFLVARKIIQTKNKIQRDHGGVRLSVQWIKVKPVQGLGPGFRNFSSAAAEWPNVDLVPFKLNWLQRRNEWANGHHRSRVARLPSPLKAKEYNATDCRTTSEKGGQCVRVARSTPSVGLDDNSTVLQRP